MVLALLLDSLGVFDRWLDLMDGFDVLALLEVLLNELALDVEGGGGCDALLVLFWKVIIDVLLDILDSNVGTHLMLVFDVSDQLLDVMEGLEIMVGLNVLGGGLDHSDRVFDVLNALCEISILLANGTTKKGKE